MAEQEYRPAQQTALERQPQGIPSLDVWMVQRIQQEKLRRGLSEGERLDPWYVSDSFLTYKDKIVRAEMDVRGLQAAHEAIETETQEEQAFWNSANRVHEAYDIIAYPHYDVHHQRPPVWRHWRFLEVLDVWRFRVSD